MRLRYPTGIVLLAASHLAAARLGARGHEKHAAHPQGPGPAESEGFFRAIFDSSPAAVAVLDESSRLTAANPALADLLGYTVDELSTLHLADVAAPADADRELEQFERLLNGEIDDYRLETSYVHRDGHELRCNLRVSLVDRGADRPRLAIAVVEDMTERLRRSQELETAGRLAGGIAHDFNNLLTAIVGYADILRAGLPPDGELRADADEVRKAAERAAELTRQLLAFSRQVAAQSGGETLLVVEDEQLVRDLVAGDLRDRGYTVLTAGRSAEALALASTPGVAVDVLVTDVVMPELGGPELARALAEERPGLKVIYLSGRAERAVVDELAPWPLLRKPFTVGELADAVQEVLAVPAAV